MPQTLTWALPATCCVHTAGGHPRKKGPPRETGCRMDRCEVWMRKAAGSRPGPLVRNLTRLPRRRFTVRECLSERRAGSRHMHLTVILGP